MRIILVLLFLQAGVAYALTGNELYKFFQLSDEVAEAITISYVMGVVDAEQRVTETMKYIHKENGTPFVGEGLVCFPYAFKYSQVRDMVKNHLVNHPETRHNPASMIVNSVLIEKWGCN